MIEFLLTHKNIIKRNKSISIWTWKKTFLFYFILLNWIVLMLKIENKNEKNYLFISNLGLIWSEVKQLWDVGLQEYVHDMWNVIDFITNSLYVATVALRVVSYFQVSLYVSQSLVYIFWNEANSHFTSSFYIVIIWKENNISVETKIKVQDRIQQNTITHDYIIDRFSKLEKGKISYFCFE